jgi:hypothetical protein
MVIHLGVHNHFVADEKCQEFVEETRKLIVKKVDRTPNANIIFISLNGSKTFFASYLLDYCNNGTMEFFKGGQLEHIQNKFCEFSYPNVHNLVVSFKCHSGGGYIDNILELKCKSQYDYIHECCFSRQVHGQKVFIIKMSINGLKNGVNLVT